MEGWKLVLIIAIWVTLPLLLAGLIAYAFATIRGEYAEENKRYPVLRRYYNFGLAALALPQVPGVLVDIYHTLGGRVSEPTMALVTVLRLACIPCYMLVNRARKLELHRLMEADRRRGES